MLKILLKNVHLKIGFNWVNLEQKIILFCGCSLYALLIDSVHSAAVIKGIVK